MTRNGALQTEGSLQAKLGGANQHHTSEDLSGSKDAENHTPWLWNCETNTSGCEDLSAKIEWEGKKGRERDRERKKHRREGTHRVAATRTTNQGRGQTATENIVRDICLHLSTLPCTGVITATQVQGDAGEPHLLGTATG
uniref:Uncharacterized protein n=1 Tax=Molossus molossus TaxID=27622 RepID=A0A7J8JXL7_MOLMO|nr:hypothetical protein HJG59_008056 [Molossus molossus]